MYQVYLELQRQFGQARNHSYLKLFGMQTGVECKNYDNESYIGWLGARILGYCAPTFARLMANVAQIWVILFAMKMTNNLKPKSVVTSLAKVGASLPNPNND